MLKEYVKLAYLNPTQVQWHDFENNMSYFDMTTINI